MITNIQIGVMGGAFNFSKKAIKNAFIVGETISENNCVLITGATTGIPFASVLGAKSKNGLCIGISPARDLEDHIINYGKPVEGLDGIIYTNMGYNGREPINIASCDGVIFIGGEFGTLIEFGQAFYEGKILGVLTGIGGISEKIKEIVSYMKSNYGSIIIYDNDPRRLTERIIEEIKQKQKNKKNLLKKAVKNAKLVKEIINKEFFFVNQKIEETTEPNINFNKIINHKLIPVGIQNKNLQLVDLKFFKKEFFLDLLLQRKFSGKEINNILINCNQDSVVLILNENLMTTFIDSKIEFYEGNLFLFKGNIKLIPAIIQETDSLRILMICFMNKEALEKTVETSYLYCYSRTFKKIIKHDNTSECTDRVVDIKLNKLKNAVLIKVEQKGNVCHTGRYSCFYREIFPTHLKFIAMNLY